MIIDYRHAFDVAVFGRGQIDQSPQLLPAVQPYQQYACRFHQLLCGAALNAGLAASAQGCRVTGALATGSDELKGVVAAQAKEFLSNVHCFPATQHTSRQMLLDDGRCFVDHEPFTLLELPSEVCNAIASARWTIAMAAHWGDYELTRAAIEKARASLVLLSPSAAQDTDAALDLARRACGVVLSKYALRLLTGRQTVNDGLTRLDQGGIQNAIVVGQRRVLASFGGQRRGMTAADSARMTRDPLSPGDALAGAMAASLGRGRSWADALAIAVRKTSFIRSLPVPNTKLIP